MTVSNWKHDQDIALYRKEIADLHEQIQQLYKELNEAYDIHEIHRQLNGTLREENLCIRKQLKYERSHNNDDGF